MVEVDPAHQSLVGRGREVARLRSFLAATNEDVLILAGPHGSGKTALINHTLGDDTHKIVRAAVQPRQPGDMPAAWNFVQAFKNHPLLSPYHARYRRIISDAIESDQSAQEIAGRLHNLFRRIDLGGSPMIFVFEDLQYLDDLSAEVLRSTLRLAAWHPWKYVCTTDIAGWQRFTVYSSMHLCSLEMGPAAQILQQIVGQPLAPAIVREICRRSAGLPGCLHEIGNSLTAAVLCGAEPIPTPTPLSPRAQVQVNEALQNLGPQATELLALLADRDCIPRAAAETLVGDPEQALLELERAALIYRASSCVRIRFPLAAEAALTMISHGRSQFHDRAAIAWQDLDPVDATMHQARGSNPRQVDQSKVLEQAQQLARVGDLDRAHRLVSAVPSPITALRAYRAELELQLGYPDVAAVEIEQLLQEGTDPESALRARLTLLEARAVRGHDWSGLLTELHVTTARLPAAEHVEAILRACHHLTEHGASDDARQLMWLLPTHDAPVWSEQGLAITIRHLIETEIDALTSDDMALPPHFEDFAQTLTQATTRTHWTHTVALIDDLLAVGSLQAARTLANHSLATLGTSEHLSRNGHHMSMAHVELAEGNYPAAESRLNQLGTVLHPDCHWLSYVGARLRTDAVFGRISDVLPPITYSRTRTTDREIPSYDADRGHALLIHGHYAQAAGHLVRALRYGRLPYQGGSSILADALEALIASHQPDAAQRLYDLWARRVLDRDTPRGLTALRRSQLLLSEPPDVDDRLASALSAADYPAAPELETGRALLAYGRLLFHLGDYAGGQESLARAADSFTALGFHGWARNAARTAHRYDDQTGTSTLGETAPGLSANEQVIVAHLRRGLTYDEIARQQYVSRRTIATRIRTIYQKYGVDKRDEFLAAINHADRPNTTRTNRSSASNCAIGSDDEACD